MQVREASYTSKGACTHPLGRIDGAARRNTGPKLSQSTSFFWVAAIGTVMPYHARALTITMNTRSPTKTSLLNRLRLAGCLCREGRGDLRMTENNGSAQGVNGEVRANGHAHQVPPEIVIQPLQPQLATLLDELQVPFDA